jgi:gliding motility-associated-like protein
MRKYLLLLFIALASSFIAFSQDFSNKGKDFWTGYGYHTIMTDGGNAQDMVLYFATDQITTVTVSIPGIGYTKTYSNIPANTVFQTAPMPKGQFVGDPDARLFTEGILDKGIHITSDKAIIAYAHIYNSSVSGASILYPTNTLGKEYYSVNYTNISNVANANCWFYVVAADTGTTVVEITPSQNTKGGWTAGNTYTVSLTQGQIYNVMGTTSGNNGVDLTGSKIKSVASGVGGCKRIGVFSGSGRIAISCNGTAPSSDNYMVQALPKTAWGKKYLTVPTNNYGNTAALMQNTYRICVTDPTTAVKVNGLPIGVPLNGNFYYQLPSSTTLQKIEADKPIMVAQYLPSQGTSGCGTVAGDGDPEVIYLSSVEQSINTVRWDACSNFQINANKHYINVIIPNTGTAISSCKLDGVTVPAGSFTVHPQDPNYSYAVIKVSGAAGVSVPHVLQSDSGFNAIAYGYGAAESYGYNAGTNVKDLYQQIGVFTPYGIETIPSVCIGSPFKFKVSLPYCADSIVWDLSNLPVPPVPPTDTIRYTTCTPGPGGPDSTTIVNGKTVNWYSLPGFYNINTIGLYPVSIRTFAPDLEGCGSVQDIDFTLQVSDPPIADYSWSGSGCVAEPVKFNDNSTTVKPTYLWYWDFGDPASGGANNTSNIKSPSHLFSAPGDYVVRYANITTPGCLSDTISHTIHISDLPKATIAGAITLCINSTQPDIVFTGSEGTPEYIFSYNIDNGSGPGPTVNVPSLGGITSIKAATNVAGTFRYNLIGVKNSTPAGTACTRTYTNVYVDVTITPDATIKVAAGSNANPTVCINTLMPNIVFDLGGSAMGAVADASTVFPPGVTGAVVGTTYVISGTPTAPGTYNYQINTQGPCLTPFITGTIKVNDDAGVNLSPSSAGPATQTVCINNLITPITFDVTGGGTNASVTFTPPLPGVSGAYNGPSKTFTITGTPTPAITTATTYNYTVTATGPCLSATATGSITVNPDATITLAAGSGPANPTVCVNTPLVNIVYDLKGSATGAVPDATSVFPPGVTGAVVGTTYVISGTPNVAGVYNYRINSQGPCLTPFVTGTITVNDDAGVFLSPSSAGPAVQTVCINKLIVPITFSVTGGGTNASVIFTPPLPGVSGAYSGPSKTFTITGAPNPAITTATTYNYIVTATGPCLSATSTGSITVNPDATITLAAGSGAASPTLCVNTLLTNIVYDLKGSAIGAVPDVTSVFPPGVTGAVVGTTYVISGTPTVAGTYIYRINSQGPCVTPFVTGTITVNDDAGINLSPSSAGPATQTVCVNTLILPITYNVTGGGTNATVTFTPPLPGVSGVYNGPSKTFTITGAPNPAITAPATYNYTVNVTGPCLPSSIGGSITVNPDATITLAAGSGAASPSLCVNTLLTNIVYDLKGSATGAVPDVTSVFPPGVTGGIVGTTYVISGTPSAPGAYTYRINSQGPCAVPFVTGTITVKDDGKINLAIGSGPATQEVCRNINIAPIQFAIAGGATGATISPALPTGITGTYSGGTYTIQGAATTAPSSQTYTITTTGSGCVENSATITLTIDQLPTANFNYSSPDCQSKFINFTDASVANSGVLNSWIWDFGDPASGINNTSNSATPSHIFSAAGVYQVKLTVGTDKTCSSTPIIRSVTVNVNPKTGFMVPEACVNDVAVFTDTSKISAGTLDPAGYYWDFADVASGPANTSTTMNGSHQFSTPGTYHVMHVSTSALGCKDTAYNDITVNAANPTSAYTVQNAAALCSSDTVRINNQSSVTFGAVTKIEIWWDNTGAPAVFDTHLNPLLNEEYKHKYPTLQTTKTYDIRFRAYSGSTCFTDVIKTITVNATPKVQLNAFPDACYDAAPYALTQGSDIGGVPGSGAYTGPGITGTNIFNPALAGIGTHTIKYTYTATAAGCLDSMSRDIIVRDTATANFSFSKPVCDGDPVSFKDESSAPAGINISTVTWDFGDLSAPQTVAAGTTVSHVFPGANTYNVKLYNTSDYGCKSTVRTQSVKISPQPVPAFAFVETSVCLPNAIVNFSNTSSIADGTGLTYTWDYGDGSATSSGVAAPHQFTGVGPYTVTLAVRSVDGCIKTVSHVVNFIHPQPHAVYTTNKASVCIADDVVFTDVTDPLDGTTTTWNWKLGDGSIRSTKSFTYTYSTVDSFYVALYITNSHGCNSDTTNQLFAVYPYPAVNAGIDRTILEGGSVKLDPTVTGDDLTYLWTPNIYFNNLNRIKAPTASLVKEDITYTLSVTALGGCTASDKVFIQVLKFPGIPNTFSPNNDGINDVWAIQYLNTYPDNRVQVFTKTGQLVFESHGYTKPWDGTLKGKPLPIDTYYYVIEPGNGRDPITGFVTILK